MGLFDPLPTPVSLPGGGKPPYVSPSAGHHAYRLRCHRSAPGSGLRCLLGPSPGGGSLRKQAHAPWLRAECGRGSLGWAGAVRP